MPSNQSYTDLVIRQQVLLERRKGALAKDFLKILAELREIIKGGILLLDSDINSQDEKMSKTAVNKLIADLRKQEIEVFDEAITQLNKGLKDVAVISAATEATNLERTVDLGRRAIKTLGKRKTFEEAISRPLSTDGDLLEPWIKNFKDKEIDRISNAIRQRWADEPKTNAEIVRELIGTKKNNYTDGVLNTTRRNAETIVRTSTQHVASAARQDLWEANSDIVDKYEWVSTLDSVTSPVCRDRDGEIYDIGKGPLPPAHPNCRSTTTAVLSPEFDYLNEGRTRSAEFGPVSAETSYYEWLKRQNAAFQDQVLGKTRGKLFRNGGLTVERFKELQLDRNFNPMTLDEMRELEPEAFKKAGL